MSSKGIMRRARLPYLVASLLFAVPRVFAQAPASDEGDDLDVTMRVIVDPNAKVPDEIVRKIPLPKPAQPAAPAKPDEKPKDKDKPNDAAKPAPAGTGAQAAPDVREQGRAFGQQVSEEAKQRSEDARRNDKPDKPDKPPKPPKPR
jgi:hypothetical protein